MLGNFMGTLDVIGCKKGDQFDKISVLEIEIMPIFESHLLTLKW